MLERPMSETRALAPTEAQLGSGVSQAGSTEANKDKILGTPLDTSERDAFGKPLIEPTIHAGVLINQTAGSPSEFDIQPMDSHKKPDLTIPIGREAIGFNNTGVNTVNTNGVAAESQSAIPNPAQTLETSVNGKVNTPGRGFFDRLWLSKSKDAVPAEATEFQLSTPDRTKGLTRDQRDFVANEVFARIAKNGAVDSIQSNKIIDQALIEFPEATNRTLPPLSGFDTEYNQMTNNTQDTLQKVEFPNPDEGWEKTQIMNPEVKKKIKRLMNSKIAKAIIGVGIAVLLLAMDDKGPQVVRGNNPDDLGPNVPERTIDPKLLEDLVGKPLREWFWPRATHPTPWATVIPNGIDYTPPTPPNKSPDVKEPLDPRYLHDSIEMDLKGESIGGWADKIAVMFSDPYVAREQLKYANQKGVAVADPDVFMKTYNQDPQAARQMLELSLRAAEQAHAGLPDNSIVLQGGLTKLRADDPELLKIFRDKVVDSARANNPNALGSNNDQLTGTQTRIRFANKLFEESKQSAQEARAAKVGAR